jgi:Ca2+/H+ antiporter
MLKFLDILTAWIYWGVVTLSALIAIAILTLAFPLFIAIGLMRNWKKDHNLLIALALISAIVWAIVLIKHLFTV